MANLGKAPGRCASVQCRLPQLVILSYLLGVLSAVLLMFSPSYLTRPTLLVPRAILPRVSSDFNISRPQPTTDQQTTVQETIKKYEAILRDHGLLPDPMQVIITNRTLDRNIQMNSTLEGLKEQVTVLLYSFNESPECLKERVDVILREYPEARTMVASNTKEESVLTCKCDNVTFYGNVPTEGKALALMTSEVKSKYFLYLSPRVHIYPHASDQGVGWLYHALETIPELDFVGGSFLREDIDHKTQYPWLEIPCYRLRLCGWSFSQSMEYRYSVGDLMICEETSQSFMGRTDSVRKVGSFDHKLITMATTDFFLQAKGKAVVGLRPEVYFHVSKKCAAPPDSDNDRIHNKFPFMTKHHVFRLKNSFGEETKVSDPKQLKQINPDTVFWQHDTFAGPGLIEGLGTLLRVGGEFFESKNISYFIDAGVALGGVKMRKILPWDSGDIDTGFFGNWKTVKEQLEEYSRVNKINARVSAAPMSADKKELMLFLGKHDSGVNTMFPHDGPVPDTNFMNIYINGRLYPVGRSLFHTLRIEYGISYLEMRGRSGNRINCKKPGHHACLPKEFASGGGHWRDYYCDL